MWLKKGNDDKEEENRRAESDEEPVSGEGCN